MIKSSSIAQIRLVADAPRGRGNAAGAPVRRFRLVRVNARARAPFTDQSVTVAKSR